MGQDTERQRQRKQKESVRVRSAAAAAKRDRTAAQTRGALEGMRRGCLFCRRTDVPFDSVEHIFPESLGNTGYILPYGVVCTDCNNGTLALLDRALCDFAIIPMLRLTHNVLSKRGRLPEVKFDNGSLVSTQPGTLKLQLSAAKWIQHNLPAPPGRTSFSFTAQMSKYKNDLSHFERVQRALVKIAVECAWRDFGEERLLTPEFDRERDLVLKGGHHGYVLAPRSINPQTTTVGLHYSQFADNSSGQRYLGLVVNIFGCWLATDTFHEEPQGPAAGFNVMKF